MCNIRKFFLFFPIISFVCFFSNSFFFGFYLHISCGCGIVSSPLPSFVFRHWFASRFKSGPRARQPPQQAVLRFGTSHVTTSYTLSPRKIETESIRTFHFFKKRILHPLFITHRIWKKSTALVWWFYFLYIPILDWYSIWPSFKSKTQKMKTIATGMWQRTHFVLFNFLSRILPLSCFQSQELEAHIVDCRVAHLLKNFKNILQPTESIWVDFFHFCLCSSLHAFQLVLCLGCVLLHPTRWAYLIVSLGRWPLARTSDRLQIKNTPRLKWRMREILLHYIYINKVKQHTCIMANVASRFFPPRKISFWFLPHL